MDENTVRNFLRRNATFSNVAFDPQDEKLNRVDNIWQANWYDTSGQPHGIQ